MLEKSAITLTPRTDEVNNTDHLVTKFCCESLDPLMWMPLDKVFKRPRGPSRAPMAHAHPDHNCMDHDFSSSANGCSIIVRSAEFQGHVNTLDSCNIPLALPQQVFAKPQPALSCWKTHCHPGVYVPWRVCLIFMCVWGRWFA